MPDIKVQRDTKIILALTETEANHLLALLYAANSPCNNILSPVEEALSDVCNDTDVPCYGREDNAEFYTEVSL